jgi:hypothetical protein
MIRGLDRVSIFEAIIYYNRQTTEM